MSTPRIHEDPKMYCPTTPGADTVRNDWFNLGVNVYRPGTVARAHQHDRPQFYAVFAGKAKMTVGQEEKVVAKGGWVFVPAGVDHSHEVVGDEPFAYLLIGGGPPQSA